jgi:hypothetical protein
MKMMLWIISGMIIILGAADAANPSVVTNAASEFSRVVPSVLDDEDPIIVRGHVRNSAGLPVVGGSVKLKKNGVVTYQATTNSSGAYLMSGVVAGNYVLQLSATGYQTKAIDLSISSEVIRIDTLLTE